MVMVEGRVSEMGSYEELLKQNGAFAEFLRNYSLEDIIEEDEATGGTPPRTAKIMSGWACLSTVFHVSLCFYVFIEDLIEDEELFPEDALSNHTDMVDNEPMINEAKRNFIRY